MPFWFPFVGLAFLNTTVDHPLGIGPMLSGRFPAAEFLGDTIGALIIFFLIFTALGVAMREPFPPAESLRSERPPWDA
jgi:hypothetical protein